MEKHDIIIIGAGVSGCACARELSRYTADILVLEKESDVCCGTSKANSAIVHAGFDAASGSLMAKLNVEGSKRMEALSGELDFSYRRNGSLVVCLDPEELPKLKNLYENGIRNGVEGLELLSGEQARTKEPNLADSVVAALWAPTGAIVCPFGLTIALAENAFQNGVQFRFNTRVDRIEKDGNEYRLLTTSGLLTARCIINAAGVYSDVFHNAVSREKIRITPRKGEYLLLDRSAGGHVKSTVFQLPGKYGKGVLVSPTVHGNLLVGPTAHDIGDRDDVSTTAAGLAEVTEKAGRSVRNIPFRSVITSFSGLRAHEDRHEFIIGMPEDAPGFVDVAGIESPGLSSAPAIGLRVAEIVRDWLSLRENPGFNPNRKGILDPKTLSQDEYNRLIRREPAYGRTVCRCEQVTEGEILDAIRRPLGARDLDGIKRRTRAGMGRCQAGFCTPRVMALLAQETGRPLETVTKKGGFSLLLVGENKDTLED